MAITDEQVSEALHMHGEWDGGLWGLPIPGGGRHWYSEAIARAVVKACLILGVTVTGTITGEAWLALAERVEAIEQRLDRYGA
jgi:hypothetical protein